MMNETTQSFEKHLTVCKNDQSLLDCLSENCPQISKQKLKLAMKYGAVWITPYSRHNQFRNSQSRSNQSSKTTRIRRAKKLLQVGDQVHLYYDETILFSNINPAILVADEVEYSVWNKPCGMFSQGSKWGDHTSIARWVELFGLVKSGLSERPCYLVHRLDRATNGLILVAHSKQAANQLAQLFETRKIQKRYAAVVTGEYNLSSNPSVIDSDIDGKSAISIILSANYHRNRDQTALNVEIKTGRKHQIRRHLSAKGFPVVGDRFYRPKQTNLDIQGDLMLRACSIEFICPFQKITKSYVLDSY